jgi:hypothetical protein
MINRKPSGRDKRKGAAPELKVNLSDKEAREAFIKSRLDMLFSDITDAYGQTLASELRRRLEYTIKVFHEDTIALLKELAEHSRVKMVMNDEIRQGKSLEELIPEDSEPLYEENEPPVEEMITENIPAEKETPEPKAQKIPGIPSKETLFRPKSEAKKFDEGDL